MATIRTLRARPPPASSGVPERSSWLSPATSGGVSGRSPASQSSTASWATAERAGQQFVRQVVLLPLVGIARTQVLAGRHAPPGTPPAARRHSAAGADRGDARAARKAMSRRRGRAPVAGGRGRRPGVELLTNCGSSRYLRSEGSGMRPTAPTSSALPIRNRHQSSMTGSANHRERRCRSSTSRLPRAQVREISRTASTSRASSGRRGERPGTARPAPEASRKMRANG
ncbi:Uncharacterised protein [Pseudomonas aeruginosa]|nr:Uncharacterised protein [Pseudomonas aeruginosa]